MQRKNFYFKFEWQSAIAHLPGCYRLEVYEAAVRYAETGETGPMSAIAAEAFEKYIMPDFRRRAKAAEYRARAKARRAAKEAEASATPKAPQSADMCEPEVNVDRKKAPRPTLNSPLGRHPDFFH